MADYGQRRDDRRFSEVFQRLGKTESEIVVLAAKVERLEENQKEHRAIVIGDGLEGKGGLRAELAKQNKILYGLLVIVGLSVPDRVADIVKLLKGVLHLP